MKNRFSTVDIIAIVGELQKYIGMRVNQVYDVDSKTYLFKLNRYEEKVTLLLESGVRIHTTDFEWPKSLFPSGFAMKLRKHVKNKRLEKISQLGIDRILDIQFGINDAAYHLIIEMYDRGNIVLTDCNYLILNILRPRTDHDDVKFVVKEKYPVELARQADKDLLLNHVTDVVRAAKPGDSLKKILVPLTPYGGAMITHVLLVHNFPNNASIGKGFDPETDMQRLLACVEEAEAISKGLSSGKCQGYVIQDEKVNPVTKDKMCSNAEFHPYLFKQYESTSHVLYPSFDKAVDNFFSSMESQKIDSKVLQKEKEAMKKLENVKKDHEQRLNKLLKEQEEDVVKANLIELNLDLVEKAILAIRSAVANQVPWAGIWDLIQEAQAEGDPVAKSVKKLKLETNHFTVLLGDPFNVKSEGDSKMNEVKPQLVDIDLDLSAYGNARKYYDRKRQHAKKEQKTIQASEKAFKNAEKRTKETLKEVAVISTITKARKPMWFEKFIWFISSENYLVIAGKDIQQNEVIVKRYMKPGDVYVHADIHGASSVVIKNNSKSDIPPKTLNEAGTLSVCYSSAWEARILTSAWWVYHHQVSKTAPTGEYLTAGSFMIRGKKNYLLPSQLTLGFGFLFKLGDDESIERHREERKIKQDLESLPSVDDDNELIDIGDDNDAADDDHESQDDGDLRNSDEKLPESNCNTNDGDEVEAEHGDNDDEEESSVFPDTKVQLNVIAGKSEHEGKSSFSYDKEDTLIIAYSKRSKKQGKTKSDKKSQVKNDGNNNNDEEKDKLSSQKDLQPKRGQKGKLKKMKEKYKDQDEEERKLRLEILGSAGESKGDKKKKKQVKLATLQKPVENDSSKEINKAQITETLLSEGVTSNENEKVDKSTPAEKTAESDDDDEDEELHASDERFLLNTLTGCPSGEDELLYAIPVCAPYSSVLNYKYKVKMMPGTNRRGKAAKTALNIFVHDKSAGQREKDCLRSVKDQDVSRNFPSGKIKLAYANVKRK